MCPILFLALGSALLSPGDATAAAAHSIQAPHQSGDVGFFTSLVLDAAGNPVVSYSDHTNNYLQLLHCNDPNCAGGDDSTQSPDTASGVGDYTSLTLDSVGNPVASYYDDTNDNLKLLHCNDPNCAGAGDSIQSPDTAGAVGPYTSLVLDAAGNPVVSYSGNGDLKVLHCNDPYCVGANESIQSPDTTDNIWDTSLVLDAAGNPVVSYYTPTTGDLKLLHCNDPNCAGGNDSIQSPDTGGDVGQFPSLALDAAGNPVVSFSDSFGDNELKVIHCNDPNCAGGNESIVQVDIAGDVGSYTSLVLDASGNPVVSYWDETNGDLKLLHCNDQNCAGGNESTQSPDTNNSGLYTSLTLDASGNPVVSYLSSTNTDLKVLHCANQNCSNDSDSDGAPDNADLNDDNDACTDEQESAGSAAQGGQRNPKNFWDFFDTPDAANVRDRVVTAGDIARVVARFGSTGDPAIDPLSAPSAAPAYHTAFDRSPAPPSGDIWDVGPPNGSITASDLAAVVAQFGHSCA
ncbi:MAG: flexitail domain-containing putative surface protein [Dehalococcoidia bacterium]